MQIFHEVLSNLFCTARMCSRYSNVLQTHDERLSFLIYMIGCIDSIDENFSVLLVNSVLGNVSLIPLPDVYE